MQKQNVLANTVLAIFWSHSSKKAVVEQTERDLWLSKTSGELQSSLKKYTKILRPYLNAQLKRLPPGIQLFGKKKRGRLRCPIPVA